MACLPVTTWASEVPNLTITENTNPKIAELYQQLQNVQNKVSQIQSERIDKLSENYQAVKENEQSLENRTLTALTTAATGIGSMELMRGMAEQSSDKDAEADMTAYIETMRCSYGEGKQVKAGPDEIELPGANDQELMNLRAEYLALAADLKERKEALGMKPGIESEEILDRASSGLYDAETIGITKGSYESLYRAQMLDSEVDQQKIEDQKSTASNRVKGGAIAAGAGVVGGIVGNAIINKDAPKNESKKINAEYDKQVAEAKKKQEDITNQLNQAIAENATEVQNYNDKIQQHKDQIATINHAPKDCQKLFADYISAVSNLSPIENETDSVPDTELPDISEQKTLLAQCTQCDTKGAVFDSETKQCSCPTERPVEKDGQCVEKTIETTPTQPRPVAEPEDNSVKEPVQNPEEDTKEPIVPNAKPEENSEEETIGNSDKEQNLVQYCPATGNGLKSINDKTMVGDVCSSTNIQVGEVILRKDRKTCTCVASACNSGYYFKGGACYTEGKAVSNLCQRSIHKETNENNTTQKCVAFCGKVADKAGCKYSSVVMRHSTKECICNPNVSEIDAARKSMQRAIACPTQAYPKTNENNTTEKCKAFCRAKSKEKNCKNISVIMQHSTNQCICNPSESEYRSSNIYKKVCGTDRGKTGKTEYCIDNVFNWVNTQIGQAIGFSQEYARLKHGKTIMCSQNHRTSGNDDYVTCTTNDNSVYYEFKFDDIRESNDTDRRRSERFGLCKLIGGKTNVIKASLGLRSCDGLTQAKCADLNKIAKKFGHEVKWQDDTCKFTDYGQETLSSEKFENSLAKIDGLDNYAFYKLQVVSIRKNFVLEDDLKKYVQGKISVTTFSCDPGYKTVTKADGILQKITADSDDIKRCYINKKPFDFVFNDLSELLKYERDAGESGSKCIANNGKFDGHYCRGLTKSECFELEKLLLKELKTKGWAGDEDLVDWDESAGACELNAAQFANNVNKTGKYTAIAGLTVGGVVSGGSTTAVAVGLMATELAGMAGEIYVERKKELLPQQWANEFLAASRSCKSSACAETTLRSNFGKISQVSDMLNRDVLQQVDTELARLGELLPEDRLINIMNDPQAPNCWETWECQERIFIVMQMASLGVAVGKALVKFTKVIAKKAGTVATKRTTALAKMPSNADDVTSVTKGGPKPGPTGGGADDAAKGADTTSNGAKATNAADDSARTGSKTKGTEHNTDSGAHKSGTNEGSSNSGQNANDSSKKGSETSGSANNAGKSGAGATNGASKAKQSLHGDLFDLGMASDFSKAKRALILKYQPDRVAVYKSKELTDITTKIMQKLNSLDANSFRTLSEADALELSRQMQEYDRLLAAAKETERAAAAAAQSAKTANKADDAADVARDTGETQNNTIKTTKSSGQNTDNVADAAKTGNKTEDAAKAANEATDNMSKLRQSASKNFDEYLAEAKNNASGKSDHIIPKSRLNDAEWKAINESLGTEDIQLVEVTKDGKTYMQFVRKTTKTSAQNAANSAKVAEKAEKIRIAKESDNLGYHGTDADIAMTDKIRPSGNTSGQLGSVGYGIAKNYDDAERYAIRRLIERQNPGKHIEFDFSNGVFKIRSSEPLNLSNKTGYVYTTAKESDVRWDNLFFSHSRNMASPAAKMPNAVEILDKATFNLDDLIRSGKIEIIY